MDAQQKRVCAPALLFTLKAPGRAVSTMVKSVDCELDILFALEMNRSHRYGLKTNAHLPYLDWRVAIF